MNSKHNASLWRMANQQTHSQLPLLPWRQVILFSPIGHILQRPHCIRTRNHNTHTQWPVVHLTLFREHLFHYHRNYIFGISSLTLDSFCLQGNWCNRVILITQEYKRVWKYYDHFVQSSNTRGRIHQTVRSWQCPSRQPSVVPVTFSTMS